MFYFVAANMIVAGVVIAYIGHASRTGLKRNWWAGLRTPATMASEEAFRAANQRVWKLYYAMAAVTFLQGIGVAILAFTRASDDTLAMFILAGVCCILALAGAQVVLGSRAAKEYSAAQNTTPA
ncbi:SdpI family protein [Corynebacterium felinum]|uniref:Membrane protein n=1 Tax=Corynebacterium felinum TaxID=131318 RepID=A0ABU2B8Z0_9CORY|nr:SdpI family protein [Corynebacterium felinum]MDF5821559.1 SdpI family protein [Corynebacterium felinum]MDR7355083.1 putative membrane protein [Corynebacterium felinum]WJY94434.1 hypothetical protein CFELI_04005 [Corynebacterium felinum]